MRRLVLLLATLVIPAVVQAEPWPPPYDRPAYTPPQMGKYNRAADETEGRFWENKNAVTPTPLPPAVHFPGLPPPWQLRPHGLTKTGPMQLGDLNLTADGKGGFRGKRPGYRFSIDSDGSIHFADRPPIELGPALLLGMVGIVGTFDLTDLVMRLHGDDPYSYDKARVIDLTREMRSKMTDRDRAHRLREAVAVLPRQLLALWSRRDLAPAARRKMLFSLWDELLEGGTSAEARAASEARTTILTFVRTRIPAGTTEAFTPTELTQLNARRRSQATFAPYTPAP